MRYVDATADSSDAVGQAPVPSFALAASTSPPFSMMSFTNGGKGCAEKVLPVVTFSNGARVRVDDEFVAIVDAVDRFRRLHDRQTRIDRVAIEDAREALRDDHGHARRLDGDRSVLARRAAAEVLLGNEDVARLHLADEPCVEILHAVLGKLGSVDHPITTGIDWPSCPPIHGYNRVTAKQGADVLARTQSGDPFVVSWQCGKGRVVAVTTRSGADWGSDFRQWIDYRRFWRNAVRWVSPVRDRPIDLSGVWRANDNGAYTVKQSSSEVSWEAVSADGGRAWTHTFEGVLQGDTISGKWFAHAPGASRGGGDLSVTVVHGGRFAKVPGTGRGFGGSVWVRDLSGVWRCNDGGSYTIRQTGLRVDWEAASRDGGKSWTHAFNGVMQGDTIVGKWLDHRTKGGGEMSVLVIDGKQLQKVPGTGEGFGGGVWTR